MEHTRTSPEQQGTSQPGTAPGIGNDNAPPPGEQARPQPGEAPFQQTRPESATRPEQATRPEPISVETAVEEEIMSKLPHTRPQRRSARRPATARKGTTKRTGATKKATGAGKSAATGRAKTTAAKNSPGLPEQALGAAISTARFPFRIGAGAARRANDLIKRIR